MNILKNYKSDLILFDTYEENGYYKKSYILKCYDDNKKQNNVLLSIYYSHCCYELYIEGFCIKETDCGGKIWHFTKSKNIKLTMYKTTYRYSKKQFEEAEQFLFLNLNSLLMQYEAMNNNINFL